MSRVASAMVRMIAEQMVGRRDTHRRGAPQTPKVISQFSRYHVNNNTYTIDYIAFYFVIRARLPCARSSAPSRGDPRQARLLSASQPL
jgi:hypothetical protein